ncbi:hypothetical protein FSOLCH5_004721 [Fusarium solani]|uniref:uncharacterized protein n=1 Tax=Fusarium solani TaxID=169388 RepID=UPI002319E641|nr:hypothetical protein MRS44_004380 [Fusarium solani]KAJ4231140.1 hypothetical protein NW759_003121 [Fusarium solani]
MKSLKGLGVNKMLGSIRRKASNVSNRTSDGPSGSGAPPSGTTPAATPEATAHNSVKAFCESGGTSKSDEVLFLPPIVDAAESSPGAATECARLIRKYMSKDYISRPAWQYNAVMLMRILTDNPGSTFTRNFDQKFADTTRALLRGVRDPSVRQILMETLDDFERTRMDDENLVILVTMWKKEKERAYKDFGGQPPQQMMGPPGAYNTPPVNPHSQNYFARHHTNRALPDPIELASRLEEARTSAKLLEQVVMNTPPTEILNNELIKEFADRCSSASRSIQGYMVSENPTPDNDTMESLIDTNEQLQTALNQHKRAVLNARKQMGLGERTDSQSPAVSPQPQVNGSNNHFSDHASPSGSGSGGYPYPDHNANVSGKGKETESYTPPPGPPPRAGEASSSKQPDESLENPFADPQPGGSSSHAGPSTTNDYLDQRLAFEPFHPGFQPTDSYLGRQDSAVGKVQMHGAGVPAQSPAPTSQNPPRPRVDEVSDDDDIYDAPRDSAPTNKQPLYRY